LNLEFSVTVIWGTFGKKIFFQKGGHFEK